MATTTNYGWTTPDDTALVKDGASAIRTLGSSVDTTTKALNPSTTLGDIEYRSSTANTNTRLGIGTTGQVLTVSGGVPAWTTASSGGMTLLETLTLSGSSVTSSSIAGTYTQIFITFAEIYGSTNSDFYMRCNSDTGSNYDWAEIRVAGSTVSGETNISDTTFRGGRVPTSSTAANTLSGTFSLPNYTSTGVKIIQSRSYIGSYAAAVNGFVHNGVYRGASAISTITLLMSGGTFTAGTVKIYGVK